ncbi:MAG: APC family permease [Sphingomicrobium sp.]
MTALKREIGLTGAIVLTFNGIVGAGIFALPGTLHQQFGNFSPFLFPIFGMLVLLIAIPFAWLSALFSVSGGPVAYVAPFGRAASFQAGWLYYVARTAALAANANVFALYAAALWPPLGSTGGRIATILALIGAVSWVNVVGVRRAIRALDAVTILKALPLVGLAVWALAQAGGAPAPEPLPSFGSLESAALLTLYAFIGFENSVVPAGETRSPERTIPRALIATVIATAGLYFLIQLAYVAVMPAGAAPDAPLAAFAEVLVGPAGIVLLSLTAMISIAGNFLGTMASTPRVTFALAERRQLPAFFGEVHARWGTPAKSILFMAALGAILAVTGSFVWLAVVSTLARLFVYGASIAALPAARRQSGTPVSAAMWPVIGGGLLLCLWAAAQSSAQAWTLLGVLVAVGLALYAIAARGTGTSTAADTVSAMTPPPSTRDPS